MNETMLADFASPGRALRGAPFWSWNAELEPAELRRQIRLMKQMGFGGFFMHARVGLATPYLSKEWFECVDACVDEARKQGMFAWIYDEDRWPSGAAGGLVTKHPAYRSQHVVMYKSREQLSKDATLLAAFDVTLDASGALLNYAKVAEDAPKTKNATRVFFAQEPKEPSSWYNNQTYLDTMNPEAVKAFISVTHEAYRKHCHTDFGGVIPGIFTDEPNYMSTNGWHRHHPAMPWTAKLPAYVKKHCKFDLVAVLPELFFPFADDAPSKARHHYYDSISQLFSNAFGKLIGDWCAENNLLYTGHLLKEATPVSQSEEVGSAMRFYPHMQAPGMDLLTERWREYDTAKQVSSVAHQFSRTWRLSETYGCTGWDFNFAGHKALGDWQAALGINLRCPHLSWYSMQGQAKRDYPASIFYQSPWFEQYTLVEDYFSRINVLLTRGSETRRILVVHPVESVWLYMAHDKGRAKPDAISAGLRNLRDLLLGEHLDFDYGEETLMHDFGSVEGKAFRLKDATYDVIVVPLVHTLRATTLARLEQFADAGGTIIWTATPELVDAAPSDRARKLTQRTTFAGTPGALIDALEPFRVISITAPDGQEIPSLLYLLREDADAAYLFVCNTSFNITGEDAPLVRDRRLAHPDVNITGLPDYSGTPLECDPETGAFYRADAKKLANGNWCVNTSFPVIGSRLFLFPKAKDASHAKFPKRPHYTTLKTLRIRPVYWKIRRNEPNVLLLESPSVKIADAAFKKPENFIFADDAIRDALHIAHRGGHMAQPWLLKLGDAPKVSEIPVILRYTFECETIPETTVDLALECPEVFTSITLNDQPVNLELVNGWWCDPSLKRVALPPAFHIGTNTLELQLNYATNFSGLENIYLLGDFGVTLKPDTPVITGRPVRLKIGHWTYQGLPFYSAAVQYVTTLKLPPRQKGRRIVLRFPAYAGTLLRVFIDNRLAGSTAWAPNEIDVTDALPDAASCELAVEIISSRRNSHGPFHFPSLTLPWTGPDQFKGIKSWWDDTATGWTDQIQLAPCGLLDTPELIIRA